MALWDSPCRKSATGHSGYFSRTDHEFPCFLTVYHSFWLFGLFCVIDMFPDNRTYLSLPWEDGPALPLVGNISERNLKVGVEEGNCVDSED